MRNVQAEKNICHVVGRVGRCENVDGVWTANNQQDCWQNVLDLFSVDAWPDGASVDTQCEYFLVINLIIVEHY